MRISDWSSDVCSSDLGGLARYAGDDILEILHVRPLCPTLRRILWAAAVHALAGHGQYRLALLVAQLVTRGHHAAVGLGLRGPHRPHLAAQMQGVAGEDRLPPAARKSTRLNSSPQCPPRTPSSPL